MMVAPLPILVWALDVEKGREDAELYSQLAASASHGGEEERLVEGDSEVWED